MEKLSRILFPEYNPRLRGFEPLSRERELYGSAFEPSISTLSVCLHAHTHTKKPNTKNIGDHLKQKITGASHVFQCLYVYDIYAQRNLSLRHQRTNKFKHSTPTKQIHSQPVFYSVHNAISSSDPSDCDFFLRILQMLKPDIDDHYFHISRL